MKSGRILIYPKATHIAGTNLSSSSNSRYLTGKTVTHFGNDYFEREEYNYLRDAKTAKIKNNQEFPFAAIVFSQICPMGGNFI